MRRCALILAPLAALAAGCGGHSSPGVAQVGKTTATTTVATGLTGYAQCMRAHGVPAFPGPDASGGISKAQVVAASKRNPGTFNAASAACKSLLPSGGLGPQQTQQQVRARRADMLSFARCMRNRGVGRFPDPNAQGELTVEMVQAQGIDVRSPQILRIVTACLPASHGALTAAKVREAIAGAGG